MDHIEFEQALSMARKYYQQSGEIVQKAWTHKDGWIFYGDNNQGRPKIGGVPIIIDKDSGKISLVPIPSPQGFKIMHEAQPIKFV